LTTFDLSAIEPGTRISETARRALALSEALVVVLPSDGSLSANSAVEVGAAWGWSKPVYVIQEGRLSNPLPDYLADYPVYPISRVDDVARAIKRGREPLTATEREVLREVYLAMKVPTDRFVQDPSLLDELARRFKDKTGSTVVGERLLYEMIRLRKQGAWPRLARKRASRSTA
jgi:hypothetical protein